MKKIWGILFFLSLMGFRTRVQGQACPGVTATTFVQQAGESNYFGVRIILNEIYPEEITITGSIYERRNSAGEGPVHASQFTIKIMPGTLTGETAADFFKVSSTSGADVIVESVNPCPVNYNQLAIQHNDALDYLHLNYSAGGPYGLYQVYNSLVDYSHMKGKTLSLSYQEMMEIRKYVTDIPTLITVMQKRYNSFTVNEMRELINLYQNIAGTTNDDEVETVLQNFTDNISRSGYRSSEKSKLLAVSPMLHTISDFWATTADFMQHPGETQTWTERVLNDPLVYNYLPFNHTGKNMAVYQVSSFRGPNTAHLNVVPQTRKCRIFCVICVALHDVVMTLATGDPFAGAVWSVFARCCICTRCGNINCSPLP